MKLFDQQGGVFPHIILVVWEHTAVANSVSWHRPEASVARGRWDAGLSAVPATRWLSVWVTIVKILISIFLLCPQHTRLINVKHHQLCLSNVIGQFKSTIALWRPGRSNIFLLLQLTWSYNQVTRSLWNRPAGPCWPLRTTEAFQSIPISQILQRPLLNTPDSRQVRGTPDHKLVSFAHLAVETIGLCQTRDLAPSPSPWCSASRRAAVFSGAIMDVSTY